MSPSAPSNAVTPRPAEASGTTSSPTLQAVNRRNGHSLAIRVTWAGTSAERRKGLLDHQALASGEGMYIVPTQWVHTFGMSFDIDVAFLDSEGRVLVVHHDLKPRRFSKIAFRAEGCLELPAGTLARTDTRVGDIVQLA